MRQQVFQVGDPLLQFGVLLLQLLALECRQAAQLHVEDRLRLDLRELKIGHQVLARRIHRLAVADRMDHLVEDVERPQQPFHDVRPLARLF